MDPVRTNAAPSQVTLEKKSTKPDAKPKKKCKEEIKKDTFLPYERKASLAERLIPGDKLVAATAEALVMGPSLAGSAASMGSWQESGAISRHMVLAPSIGLYYDFRESFTGKTWKHTYFGADFIDDVEHLFRDPTLNY